MEDKPSQLNSGGLGRKVSVKKRKEKQGTNVPTVKNNHPTVKPIALMEYLIKLVSKEEAIILDPFMGSGSTGIAAKKLNRNFIGIEMDEGYHTIASKRIGEDKKE
jgi:DNA modification methylase